MPIHEIANEEVKNKTKECCLIKFFMIPGLSQKKMAQSGYALSSRNIKSD
jgi:hypothetical protein